jgi:hypothetical protein
MDHHKRVLVNPSVGSSRKQMRMSEDEDDDDDDGEQAGAEYGAGHELTATGLLTPPQLEDAAPSREAAAPRGSNMAPLTGCSFQTDDSNFGCVMDANSPLRTATMAQQVMAEYAEGKANETEADDERKEDTTRSRSQVSAAPKLPLRAATQKPAVDAMPNSKAVILSSLPPEPSAATAAAAAAAPPAAASTGTVGSSATEKKAPTAAETAATGAVATPTGPEPKPFFQRSLSFVSAHKAVVAACGIAFILAIYLGWRFLFGGRRLSTASNAANKADDDDENNQPQPDARIAPVQHQQHQQPVQQQQPMQQQQPVQQQQPTPAPMQEPPQSSLRDQQPPAQMDFTPQPTLPAASVQGTTAPAPSAAIPTAKQSAKGAASPVQPPPSRLAVSSSASSSRRRTSAAPKKVKRTTKERKTGSDDDDAPPSKSSAQPKYEQQCVNCGSTDVDYISEDGGSEQHCVKCQKWSNAQARTTTKKKLVPTPPQPYHEAADEAHPQYSLAESIVQSVA